MLTAECQLLTHRILEINFRKNPSSNRQKPPTNRRIIQVRPLPLATRERSSATSHSSRTILIIGADYITKAPEEPAVKQSCAAWWPGADKVSFPEFAAPRFYRHQSLTTTGRRMFAPEYWRR